MTLPYTDPDLGRQQNFDALDKRTPLTTVTSLPTSPYDGQIIYFVADATNGVVWLLRYRLASSSAFKWEFVGGSALYSEVNAAENITSTTYVDAPTVGPQITLPLAGDYRISYASQLSTPALANNFSVVAPKIGSAAASDTDGSVVETPAAAATVAEVARAIVRNVSAPSTLVRLQYRVSGGTGSIERRNLNIMPVRVG